MSLFVVDASVAVKWFLPGNQRITRETKPMLCLDRYLKGRKFALLVPDLFWAECCERRLEGGSQ